MFDLEMHYWRIETRLYSYSLFVMLLTIYYRFAEGLETTALANRSASVFVLLSSSIMLAI